ncbi:MAG TPA: DMT family transporter [Caulobacteraceae bacterium]|nr:DMT family transporter [Caulobacteraceae bacterium]
MSLAQIAALMMLCSGAAHAGVNAILKSGEDKMSSRALIDGFSALLILPAAFFLPLPHGAWLWLAASGVIHLVYLFSLIKAFERADMLVAYPMMRGLAPALASLVAVALFRERITVMIGSGVACVSMGVMVAMAGRHLDRASLAWSLLTGACIALYTVADAQGVRAAPSAPSYIVWIFLIDGGVIGALFALWRGPRFILSARSEWRAGLAAGAGSIVSYGLALWAFRLGNIPRLAALRETSVLFGVLIAIGFLKERATPARLASAALIGAGAAILVASG